MDAQPESKARGPGRCSHLDTRASAVQLPPNPPTTNRALLQFARCISRSGRCKYLERARKSINSRRRARRQRHEYWPVLRLLDLRRNFQGDAVYFQNLLDPKMPDSVGSTLRNPAFPVRNLLRRRNDGDDCDYWRTEDKESKWDANTGRCRVLQAPPRTWMLRMLDR